VGAEGEGEGEREREREESGVITRSIFLHHLLKSRSHCPNWTEHIGPDGRTDGREHLDR